MLKNFRLFQLCIALCLVSGVSMFGQTKPSANTQRRTEIKIFFTNTQSKEYIESDCAAGEWVKRKVPATKKTADAALRQVFAGPTAEERSRGLFDISTLGKYYIGVTIKKGTAIVNFKPGAEKFLYVSGPICQSTTWLAAMTKTLKQFPSVKQVEYAINGKIIEDWDA